MSSLSQRSLVKDRGNGRNPVIAALDIGSSKVTCLISRRADADEGVPLVAGAGVQQTRGVRSGAAYDLEQLERSIRLAVEQAERAAGIRIDEVVVGVSGPDLRSDVVKAKLPLDGREITPQHVREAGRAALDSFSNTNRQVLHSALLGYSVDRTAGIKDPVGMYADTLTASYLVVSAPMAGLRNILQCVTRAHLNPVSVIAAPYAAGLACLVEDEAEQGAVVIDFGAGVTSAAAFCDGVLLHIEALPMGGAWATSDLAQGLGTTFAAAERIKTAHGAVGFAEVSPIEQVEAPRLGTDGRLEAAHCTKAELAEVLCPRIEEILELIDTRLSKASAAGRPLPRRIVLTGGASQMEGLVELATDVFRAPVRIAKPANIRGMGETFSSPSFAAAAGLLRSELVGKPGAIRAGIDRSSGVSGQSLFRRVINWLQENF